VPSAYLAIGGNLGDRLGFLTEAVRRLHRLPHTRVVTASSVYETAPVGPAQPDFLNAAVHLDTTLSPPELLAECQRIEAALGRVRDERWGPRTIDLDLLWYENATLAEPALTLPHPRMSERSFVLTPLAEIAPDLPLGGESVRTLAAKLGASGLRKFAHLEWTQEETNPPTDARPRR
jgi:2-amino-4-hydroxy-6-hydroxymethyldihydropteridine diphosphokinase